MSKNMTVGSLIMYAKANIERNANMDDPMNQILVAQLDDAIPKFKDLIIPDVIVLVCPICKNDSLTISEKKIRCKHSWCNYYKQTEL